MVDVLDSVLAGLEKDLTMISNAEFRGHCLSCKEPILGPTGVSYTQDEVVYSYHRTCFLCAGCKDPLDRKPFFLHATQPYCKPCFEDKVCGRCDACLGTLADATVLKASGKQFHQKCFVCAKCKQPLQSRYFEKAGSFYCRPCHESFFLPTCAACNGKILPNEEAGTITSVVFQDKKYHEACFACKDCKEPFRDLKAMTLNGDLFCTVCHHKRTKGIKV
ncbi:hypothetical protein HK102_005448 [Quaeritorhiza haematococci]|nr:hypothetical protein HK102_005448 [Quaeritorhiza haematococci]